VKRATQETLAPFLAALLLAPLAGVHAAENNKPNIIVLLTDDHGWADLGAPGVDKNIRNTGNHIEGLSTPHIQAFFVSRLSISGHKLSLCAVAPAAAVPLSFTNIVNETVSGNSRQ